MILPKTKCVNRLNYIMSECANKSVLHLGCSGSPTTIARFKSDCLLHKNLLKVTKELYGIDIDKSSIEYLRNQGIEKLFIANVEHLEEIKFDKSFEIVLAGELIEHLDNVGLMLREVKKFLKSDGVLLISVPNAFAIKHILRAIVRKDVSMPDHNYYFSYKTLRSLLKKYGFVIMSSATFYISERDGYVKQRFVSKLANKIFKNLPFFNYLADGIIVKAKVEKSND
jgi:2-polyprenyl-3-methyl-5-hydroxy-6-metoxy-1,4-benzoquinol methylase